VTSLGFLDSDDLRRLTGAARAAGQEAWLKAEGIPHKRQGARVTVAWLHVHNWLEGRPAVSFVEPDLSNVS
jgi:hypothetical protein